LADHAGHGHEGHELKWLQYLSVMIPLSHSQCLSLEWYNVSLTISTAAVMRGQQLGITLSIIGHSSRDSGISVINTVYSGIVRYHSLIPL